MQKVKVCVIHPQNMNSLTWKDGLYIDTEPNHVLHFPVLCSKQSHIILDYFTIRGSLEAEIMFML